MTDKERTMMTKDMVRIGGASSIIQAVIYAAAVIAYSLTPPDQIAQGIDKFVVSYSANPEPLTILCFSIISLSVLGLISVVPATATLFKEEDRGWVTLGKQIALLSLSVIVAYYTWFLATTPARIALYSAGDAMIKAAITANDPSVPVNWVAWFMFGGMGFWVAVVGTLVYLKKTPFLSRGFCVACLMKAGGFWIALAGIAFGNVSLITIGAITGGLIGAPLYHVWIGIGMRSAAKA